MVLPTPKLLEAQAQKQKLADSYGALLDELAAKDLRSVGNYDIGKLIGKGSFGKVYLASHKLIRGSKVVLKSADKDDANLVREIHHHRQFLHPHIARLYEVIVTERLVWLVLEYCPGDELYYYLTKNGAIEPGKAQKIFTQLVGAVSYVHQKSCVHRDLKLENILLDKNEDVKLCDFGFTREYDGKSAHLQTWCGTVCYSAPEMIRGEKYAGERVDVWSLGIILFALLVGELPFDEDDDDATKAKILKGELKYPETMPQQAKDLITQMLSKRPLLRPTLADILTNPWLVEYAPQQQAVLKLQRPPPFSTQVEKDTLSRMSGAGVDTDAIIENTLSQRCDALAGWWALLLEKEERKDLRRQRKRREREAEIKANRRISTASSRLLTLAIKEIDEERSLSIAATSPSVLTPTLESPAPEEERGRSAARPQGLDAAAGRPPVPPKTQEHRAYRPTSGSRNRRRSQLGPVATAKRNSVLHIVAEDLPVVSGDGEVKKRRHRLPPLFLANIKSWFRDPSRGFKTGSTRHDSPLSTHATSPAVDLASAGAGRERDTHGTVRIYPHAAAPFVRPASARRGHSQSSIKRLSSSHSPAPLTPRSSYRRSAGAGGLRGRKSTSSSVSSIRSLHTAHHPTHSKASSVSSTTVGSPSVSVSGSRAARRRSSDTPNGNGISHPTLKLVPATPVTKRAPQRLFAAEAFGGPMSAFAGTAPPSPGLLFTKRKRTPFKGPALGMGLRRRIDGTGAGAIAEEGGARDDTVEANGSAVPGTAGGPADKHAMQPDILEEDEDEGAADVDSFEDVDAFPPIGLGESVVFATDLSAEPPPDSAHASPLESPGIGSPSGSTGTWVKNLAVR